MCLPLLVACGGGGTQPSGNQTGGGQTAGGQTDGNQPAEGEAASGEAGGGEAAPAEKRYAEELVILTDGMPAPHLNPFMPGTPVPGLVYTFKLGWDRLLDISSDLTTYLPMLATEWKSDDLKTWTFKLRDDVYFHNGEKFTSDDVVYTVERGMASPGTMSYSVWGTVAEVRALDDYTVEIELNGPNVEFEYNLAMGEGIIFNRDAVEADPDEGHYVGTGAFKLMEFVSNNYWVMERNDNYWGAPPITKKLTFRNITEAAARSIMLLNGEAQLACSIPSDDQDLFQDNPAFTRYEVMVNNPMPINFNMTDPVAGDWSFRMAVASAINRYDIAMATGATIFSIPTDGVTGGYFMPFRNTDIPLIPYDLDKAREYLAASPYKGETITITASIGVTTSEVIQQQLSEIGIKTEIVQTDIAGLPALVAWDNNQTQILMCSYNMLLSESAIRNLYYPRALYNRTHYDNPEVTALFDAVNVEPDREKRREIHYEIQRLIAEDPPMFNLYHSAWVFYGAKGIGGFTLRPDMFYDFRYIYLELD